MSTDGRMDRIVGVLALLSAFGLAVFGLVRQQRAERPTVTSACDDIAPLWSPADRDAIHEAFAATGLAFAEASFATVDHELTRHADALAHARTESCTHAPGRTPCLERRAQAFRRLVDALGRADTEAVTHAVAATLALPELTICGEGAGSRDARADDRVHELEAIATTLALGHVDRAAAALAPFEEERSVPGSPSRGLAAALRGRLAEAKGDGATAASVYEHAVWSAIEAEDDDTAAAAALALAGLSAGKGERETGAHEQAQRWWRLAAALVHRRGASPEGALALLEAEVDLLIAREAWEAALAVSLPGLEVAASLVGAEHASLARPLVAHAVAAAHLGRVEDAREVHARVDRLIALRLGEAHPDRVRAHHRVGRALLAAARAEDAVAVLRSAAALGETIPAHEALAFHLDLGRAAVLTGDPTLARQAFARARTLAGAAVEAADAELGLGLVARSEGDHARSLVHLEGALALLQQHGGSPDAIVDTHVEHARTLAALDRKPDATRSLEQATALASFHFGAEDPRTTSTRLATSVVLLECDEPERALEQGQLALLALAHAPEPDLETTVLALTQIGWSSLSLGRDRIAAEAFGQAKDQLTAHAPDDERLSSLLLGLASALWRAGDREQALSVVTELQRGLAARPPEAAAAAARDLEAWLSHRGVSL